MASSSSRLSDITFSNVNDISEGNVPSWRNGLHADWEIQVGEHKFPAHKVILARNSKVLAASVSGSYAACGSTDLTDLLPEVVHSVFAEVLDHMYEHRSISTASPMFLFVTADILGMQSLFEQALADIEGQFSQRAGEFLHDVAQLPITDHIARIKVELINEVSCNFAKFVADGQLFIVPELFLYEILNSDDLHVASEDDIVDMLVSYYSLNGKLNVNGSLNTDERTRSVKSMEGHVGNTHATDQEIGLPWQACRLPFVSLPCLLKLRNDVLTVQGYSALLQMIDSTAHYTRILQSASPYCPCSPYKDFIASYKLVASVNPRRPLHIPATNENEIDFAVHIPKEGALEPGIVVESPSKIIDDAQVILRVFPCGTVNPSNPNKHSKDLKSCRHHSLVSIFLHVCPAVNPGHSNWNLKVNYDISVLSWEAGGGSYKKRDSHIFSPNADDRGWHDFAGMSTVDSGTDLTRFINVHGFLWIRASAKRIFER